MDLKVLVVLFVLLCISAFASSSETALFSLNRFQLRRIREHHKKAYERIRKLLAKPTRLLVLILLTNEIVNISISSKITELLQSNHKKILKFLPFIKSLDSNQEWVFTALLSLCATLPLLLLFGEITPKIIASKVSRIVAILNTKILIILYYVFLPLLWTADTIIGFILRRFKAEGKDHLTKAMSLLTEEDFMILMEEGHREGTVGPEEKRLIKNVFEFDDSTVAEVMTPLSQVFCVSSNAKISEILPEMMNYKYSRIPIYQKSKKHIIGTLYLKDMLDIQRPPQEIEAKVIMSPTMFVRSDTRLSVLFRRFKEAKTHLAVCVDSNEEALGIVTMEDLLECLFGELDSVFK